MANLKETKDKALATIDSAITILNRFPFLNDSNTYLSYNDSLNPFPFLMDLFKSCAGYDVLINILSEFIMVALPPMEVAIKAVLLANIKNLLSCSINPFISEELIRDGIVFSLDQIDITDKLQYSPSSKKGRYYYFDNMKSDYSYAGINDITGKDTSYKTAEELKSSKDFDCLLWYMKNKAMFREVWGQKVTTNDSWTSDSDYWNPNKNLGNGKCRKGAGIITLEFNARSQSLRNAEGNGLGTQTPYNNLIHVFLGNTKEKNAAQVAAEESKFFQLTEELDKLNNELIKKQAESSEISSKGKEDLELIKEQKITQEEYNERVKDIRSERAAVDAEIKKIKDDIKTKTDEKVQITKTLQNMQKNLSTADYRSVKQNYYYNRTLIEFNTDYVMSLQFFDPKVVTAQLIDALVGIMNIDLQLSVKQQVVKNEINKMIKMIIETDDTVVDDCFFSFTNDEYNDMLEKAEMNRANLFSVNGEDNGSFQIDPEKMLEKLNAIDATAIANGDVTVIEHALKEICQEISKTDESSKTQVNFGIQMNFIENLLNNLCYVIAYAVLSPKLYLLILINLKILGNEVNFSLEQFIGQFKQLIVTLLRAIRDLLIKYITEKLFKIIGNITTDLAIKIGVEQMEYYARLIKKIYDCIRFNNGSGEDWNMDNVYYADILSEDTTETEKPNASC